MKGRGGGHRAAKHIPGDCQKQVMMPMVIAAGLVGKTVEAADAQGGHPIRGRTARHPTIQYAGYMHESRLFGDVR